MQDEFSTDKRSESFKTKKSGQGKWVSRQDAEMDNEAATPSTLSSRTTSTPSTPSLSEDGASTKGYQEQLMHAINSGRDMLSKVDLSAGTKIVRDYPIQAAVGGLIVGFLVGAAVFSRRGEA